MSGTRCRATAKRTGKQCQAWAIRGATVCRVHGGMAGQVRRVAAERVALSEELERADRRPPWEILADALHTCDVLAQRARVSAGDSPDDVLALVEATERAARLAKTALDAGVEERLTSVYERVGATYAAVLGRILDRLDLTEGQRALVPGVVRGELEALTGAA